MGVERKGMNKERGEECQYEYVCLNVVDGGIF